MAVTIADLNAAAPDAFIGLLDGLYEHSPWIAAAIAPQRPFRTARALHDAARNAIRVASPDQQLALIRAHPELAGPEADAGGLTPASTGEQGRLGIDRMAAAERDELRAMNARYQAQFGFPCIIALAGHASRDSVLAEFRTRLKGDPEGERRAALEAIGQIGRARLARLMGVAGGALTLHTLDTVRGLPGADMGYTLLRHENGAWHTLVVGRTDARGRTNARLLTDIDMAVGAYRLDFEVGDYHRRYGDTTTDPPYLDIVPIAFGIAAPGEHYHVPLLFTPWSYSTYRGN